MDSDIVEYYQILSDIVKYNSQGISRVVQGCSMGVYWVVQGCFEDVPKVFKEVSL